MFLTTLLLNTRGKELPRWLWEYICAFNRKNEGVCKLQRIFTVTGKEYRDFVAANNYSYRDHLYKTYLTIEGVTNEDDFATYSECIIDDEIAPLFTMDNFEFLMFPPSFMVPIDSVNLPEKFSGDKRILLFDNSDISATAIQSIFEHCFSMTNVEAECMYSQLKKRGEIEIPDGVSEEALPQINNLFGYAGAEFKFV